MGGGAGRGRLLGRTKRGHLWRELGTQRDELGGPGRLAPRVARVTAPPSPPPARGHAARGAARAQPRPRGHREPAPRAGTASSARVHALGGCARSVRRSGGRSVGSSLPLHKPRRAAWECPHPRETMLTATIHGSLRVPEGCELVRARGPHGVQARPAAPRPVASPSSLAIRRAWVPSAATASAPASRMTLGTQGAQLHVGLAQDPGQPVGKLG